MVAQTYHLRTDAPANSRSTFYFHLPLFQIWCHKIGTKQRPTFMRRFANLFLILFLCDGIVSFTGELLYLLTATGLPDWIRSMAAWPVMLAAVPLYVILGIDSRLPKLIFLPQLLFIFWSVFDWWPLSIMLDPAGYLLPAAFCQLILGVAPLLLLKRKKGAQRLLPPDRFTAPFFSLRNTLIYFIANLIILPAVLVYMVLSFSSLQLYRQSGGFARLWPNGLQMTEKIYRHEGKEIRLTGMIHIADQTYFEKILQSISSDRTIILAEGLTDKANRLGYRFNYGGIANRLGLTSQEKMVFTGKRIEPEDVQTAAATEPNGYHILRADIDINDFQPKTVEFLNIIGKHILSTNNRTDGLRAYLKWVRENSGQVSPDSIMGDILHKRNREVIGHMGRVLGHYDTVIIPWGALHMPEIETAVLEKNFRLAETRQRTSIDFTKLLLAYLAGD